MTERQRILLLLDEGRLFLDGISSNPDIAAQLDLFGVKSEDVTEGTLLLETARTSVTQQDAAMAEQKLATEAMLKALETAYSAYTLLCEVARAALAGDKTKLALLGIVGKTPRTAATLVPRGAALTEGLAAHPELAQLLTRHGQDAAALAALQAKFAAFAAADSQQQSAKGATQRATAAQNETLKDLKAWLGKVKRLARAAFRGDKQQLEKLGIVAR